MGHPVVAIESLIGDTCESIIQYNSLSMLQDLMIMTHPNFIQGCC